jgi:hypothetical protein
MLGRLARRGTSTTVPPQRLSRGRRQALHAFWIRLGYYKPTRHVVSILQSENRASAPFATSSEYLPRFQL